MTREAARAAVAEDAEMLHPDEVPITGHLVAGLIGSQFPEWADRPLRLVRSQGTDNVVFRLGDDLAVRLPRKASAVAGHRIEQAWLPRIAGAVSLPVPRLVAVGVATPDYPFPWSICSWVPGEVLGDRLLRRDAVERLAGFVRELHAVDPSGGPVVRQGHRGGLVAAYGDRLLDVLQRAVDLVAVGRLEGELVRPGLMREIWIEARAAPAWPGPGVWVHRDLIGSNLLADAEGLRGVIDFGGLVLADPAADVMAAFHVVGAADRAAFRTAVGADDATWTRARGWALAQGLEAIVYYLDRHPGMTAMARGVLRAVTEDAAG